MNALLINPWICDFSAYDLWSKPLGLLRIASFLKRLKVKVSLIDAGYDSKEIGVYIMAGIPGQSIEEIKETVKFLSSCRVRIFLEEYSPIPNTPDYKRSGLMPDADPLLHNNIAFSYLYGQDRLHEIKDLVHRLNKR